MKSKKLKSLRLSKISKKQQKEVKGGSMKHICGGCVCVVLLDDMMGIDNANTEL